MQSYMEPLVARLEATPPLASAAVPAIDAAVHLAAALGGNIEPYAPRLLAAAAPRAAAALAATSSAGQTADTAARAAAIATFALDLVTQLIETLGRSTHALLATLPGGEPAVLSTALAAASASEPAVRQSGLALLGELAQQAPRAVVASSSAALGAVQTALHEQRLDEVRQSFSFARLCSG